jgi:hypothetical protein
MIAAPATHAAASGVALEDMPPADGLVESVRGQVLAHGLPGSGNVILQHILAAVRGPLEGFDMAKHLAFEAHIATVGAFERLARRLGAAAWHGPGYSRPRYLNASAAGPDDAVIFPAIKSRAFLAEAVYGTHALPEREDIARYREGGGKVVVVLRHPLDVITSFATKHVPRQHADRRAARDRMLADPAFVGSFAWQVEAFWERFREVEGSVVALRYEDLFHAPRILLNHVAAFLDRELTGDLIDTLLAKIGTAELAAPGHLFQARTDAWRGSLPPEMLGFLERVRPLASVYGYDWPSAGEYRPPSPSAAFHVAAYSFWHPTLRRHLEARGMLHWYEDLPYICDAGSQWVAAVPDALSADSELARLASGRPHPVGQPPEAQATA